MRSRMSYQQENQGNSNKTIKQLINQFDWFRFKNTYTEIKQMVLTRYEFDRNRLSAIYTKISNDLLMNNKTTYE